MGRATKGQVMDYVVQLSGYQATPRAKQYKHACVEVLSPLSDFL